MLSHILEQFVRFHRDQPRRILHPAIGHRFLQWGEYQPDTKEFQVQRAAKAELKSHLTWIHRAGKGADVFFIANTSLTAEGEAVFGSVSDPSAPFLINGTTVVVHPNGAFLAWVPVSPGTFTFRCKAVTTRFLRG